MNATDTNAGGWEKSELRAKMNSGEIWNFMPSDFQSKVKAVEKLTNNVSGTDKDAAVTATTDKLFLLSYSEIVPSPNWADYPWTSSEGIQYEAFKGKVTNYSGNAFPFCSLAAFGGSVRCVRTPLRSSAMSTPTAVRRTASKRRTRLASVPHGASRHFVI